MNSLVVFATDIDQYDAFRGITQALPLGLSVADVLEDLRISPDIDTMSAEVSKRSHHSIALTAGRHGCVIRVAAAGMTVDEARAFMQPTLQQALAEALVWLIRRTDATAGFYRTIADDLAFGEMQEDEFINE